MNFIKFQLVEVINPETSEVLTKLRAISSDGQSLNVFHPNHSIEDIKKDADAIRESLVVGETEFGKYAYIPNAKVLEEF